MLLANSVNLKAKPVIKCTRIGLHTVKLSEPGSQSSAFCSNAKIMAFSPVQAKTGSLGRRIYLIDKRACRPEFLEATAEILRDARLPIELSRMAISEPSLPLNSLCCCFCRRLACKNQPTQHIFCRLFQGRLIRGRRTLVG